MCCLFGTKVDATGAGLLFLPQAGVTTCRWPHVRVPAARKGEAKYKIEKEKEKEMGERERKRDGERVVAAAETRFYPVGFDVGTRVFGIGLDVQERQRKCTALDRSTPSRLPCGLPYNRPPKAGAASTSGSSQLGPGKSSIPARWNTLAKPRSDLRW